MVLAYDSVVWVCGTFRFQLAFLPVCQTTACAHNKVNEESLSLIQESNKVTMDSILNLTGTLLLYNNDIAKDAPKLVIQSIEGRKSQQ